MHQSRVGLAVTRDEQGARLGGAGGTVAGGSISYSGALRLEWNSLLAFFWLCCEQRKKQITRN